MKPERNSTSSIIERDHNPHAHGHMPDQIPSPYNFVPLSEQVLFCDQAKIHSVSHDVPLSSALCGNLKLIVTTKTPVYIRNGGCHPEGQQRIEDESYNDFFRISSTGCYAIPGTSIKGLLRNLIEIITFSKIAGTSGPQARVSNHRYAVRNLHNTELYGEHMTQEVSGGYEPKVRSAWLRQIQDDTWQITLCSFSRVEQEDLEKLYPEINLGKKQTAEQKYEQLKGRLKISFDPGRLENHDKHTTRKPLRYSLAGNLGHGNKEGILVLTGQPSDRKPKGCTRFDRRSKKHVRCSRGKHMEFIFHSNENDPIPVPKSVKDDFIFAHSELGQNGKANAEWKYWQRKLRGGEEIPVFVLFSANQIRAIGLAMMVRLPYEYDIHQTISHTNNGIHLNGEQIDFAELLFGRADDHCTLRGRISCEPLLVQGHPKPEKLPPTVLQGPKPTFYPNYIEQKQDKSTPGLVKDAYKTYMDDDAKIRGWKRYIVRPDNADIPALPAPPLKQNGQSNTEIATRFFSLPAGTTFEGYLHFHNLSAVELGALVWALTWGGNKNLRHLIGMAKPYGFGSIIIEIDPAASSIMSVSNEHLIHHDLSLYCAEFEQYMNNHIKDWKSSLQIRALCNLADVTMQHAHELRYPKLESPNEFVEFQKQKKALIDPCTARRAKQAVSSTPTHEKSNNTTVSSQTAVQRITDMSDSELARYIKNLKNISRQEYDSLKTKVLSRPSAKRSNPYAPAPQFIQALTELERRIVD